MKCVDRKSPDLFALGVLALALALGFSPRARAQTSEAFAASNTNDYAVGNERTWFENHPQDVKQRAVDCLSMLDQAQAYQDRAIDLFEQANHVGGGDRRSDLITQGNAQIDQRAKILADFRACVQRAVPQPKDTTPELQAIPGRLKFELRTEEDATIDEPKGVSSTVRGRLSGSYAKPDVSIPPSGTSRPASGGRPAARPQSKGGRRAPQLPLGAVGPGDPEAAPEVGAPGIIGSFPGTKNGEICYGYCLNGLSQARRARIPLPFSLWSDPDTIGQPVVNKSADELKPGDVLVFFRRNASLSAGNWQATHYAVYQGNGLLYFRNGPSDIYIGKFPYYFSNWVGAKVRLF